MSLLVAWYFFNSMISLQCGCCIQGHGWLVRWQVWTWGGGKYGFQEKISCQSKREPGNGVTKKIPQCSVESLKAWQNVFNWFASQVARILQRQEGVSCATSFVWVVFKAKSCWSTVQQVMIFHTGGDHLRNHQTATQSRLHKVGFQTSLNEFQRLLYQCHVITILKSITVVIPRPLVSTCFLRF